MCEALPPTLEKNTMDLGGYMSICRYIFLFVFLAKRVGGQNKVELGKAEQVSVVFEQFFPNVRFDCLFFWHLGPHFGVLVALWKTLWRLFRTLGDLGAPVWHPVVHFVTLGAHLGGFLWILGDPRAPLWHPGPPFGHPWGPFLCLWSTFGCGPGPLWPLFGKRLEKGSENDRNWEPKYRHFR